jgi:hypothetical protein
VHDQGLDASSVDAHQYVAAKIGRPIWSHFSPRVGLRFSLRKSLNIGLPAMSSEAPRWKRWLERYVAVIQRTGKINMAVHFGRPAAFITAIHTWIPALRVPIWEGARRRLCEPSEDRRPTTVNPSRRARPSKLLGFGSSPLRCHNMSDLVAR